MKEKDEKIERRPKRNRWKKEERTNRGRGRKSHTSRWTIYIYIYRILSPVKPELGVIPSGQEIIREWIFKSSW